MADMNKSDFLQLNLPEGHNNVNIMDLTDNFVTIDGQFKLTDDQIKKLEEGMGDAGKVKSVNGKVGDVELDAYSLPINYYNPNWTINDELNRKASSYELSQVEGKLDDKANKKHSHVVADVSGLQATLDSLESQINNAGGVVSVNGKQGFVTLTGDDLMVSMSWSEKISDVLWDMYSNKADNIHSHTIANVTGLQDALNKLEGQIGSAGNVNSVNGKQGKVVLTGDDINVSESWKTSLGGVVMSNYSNKASKTYVDEALEKKANKTYVDTKLKDKANTHHTHYAHDIFDSTTSKTQLEINKELFQSGVESNKTLVGALNSKGISASTSDTIRTNVGKVNDIKVGDYSVGDFIDGINLKLISEEARVIWEFTGHTNYVNGVAVDDKGYVYSGGDDKKVIKISPSGSKVWEFTGHTDWVRGVAVDNEGYVYSGGDDKKVIKISPSGSKVWEFTGHTNYVNGVAVDDKGYVYSGGKDKKVMKISPSGSKVWEFTGHTNYVNGVAVDDKGYVYSGGDDKKVIKISPSGSKVWEFTGHTDYVNGVAVDNEGYVYSGGKDNKVMKISPSGSKVWEFTGHTNYVNGVAVDNEGYVYSGSTDKKVMKISPSGSKVWEFTGHTDWVRGVVVDDKGYVYSGSTDKKVMKILDNRLYKIMG